MSKRNVWLSHFLNEATKRTFLNKVESVYAAGYKVTSHDSARNIGYANFKACQDKINKWLEEEGLSETALKLKLLSLLEAKETKFFTHQGEIIEEREVEAIETQRKTLDMAIKVRGLYAAEKRELSGPNGGPITAVNGCITPDTDPKQAALIYARLIKQDD